MSEIDQLRRTVRRLQLGVASLAAVTGIVVLSAFAPQRADVLRARGLVIEDAAGRERIVLGAPLRAASGDARLAPTVGLVVLDSAGRLQTALGTETPLVLHDGRTGRRVGGNAGLTIYDPRTGAERGGMATFADGRANLCLDYAGKSKEAVCMVVAAADEYGAVLVNGTPGEPTYDRLAMFAGADGSGVIKVFGGRANQGGFMLRAGSGEPAMLRFDSTGSPITSERR